MFEKRPVDSYFNSLQNSVRMPPEENVEDAGGEKLYKSCNIWMSCIIFAIIPCTCPLWCFREDKRSMSEFRYFRQTIGNINGQT